MKTKRVIGSGGNTATKVPAADSVDHKIKTAVRLSEALHAEVSAAMERDGYSLKGRSVWVEEALLAMSRLDPDLRESLVGDKAQGPNKKNATSISLTPPARRQLLELAFRLRLQVPILEGVQSIVLRCAMRFRIRHPECFPARVER